MSQGLLCGTGVGWKRNGSWGRPTYDDRVDDRLDATTHGQQVQGRRGPGDGPGRWPRTSRRRRGAGGLGGGPVGLPVVPVSHSSTPYPLSPTGTVPLQVDSLRTTGSPYTFSPPTPN